MPWLSIILALLSFFASKQSGASSTKAALTAGLVGAGSYYVSHETDWGKANLGALDGVSTTAGTVVLDKQGQPVLGPTGQPLTTLINGTADVLKSWGGTGTATVIGTTALATSSSLSKYLPWLAIAGLVLLLTRS